MIKYIPIDSMKSLIYLRTFEDRLIELGFDIRKAIIKRVNWKRGSVTLMQDEKDRSVIVWPTKLKVGVAERKS